jgi:hypothetical protein
MQNDVPRIEREETEFLPQALLLDFGVKTKTK